MSDTVTDTRPLSLGQLLAQGRWRVTDLVPGRHPHVHRLVISDANGQQVGTAVVAERADAVAAVEAEARLLSELRQRGLGEVLGAIPRATALVEHAGRPVLVTSAPGSARATPSWGRRAGPAEAAAVAAWLSAWWDATAAGEGECGYGSAGAERVLTAGGSLAAAERVADARARLRRIPVRRAVEHGCFCRRHVSIRDGAVTWVEDWGDASLAGEPLRDLVTYALSMAGAQAAAAIAGRGGGAAAVRQLVRAGLGLLGLPRQLWRDALVLGLSERVDGHTEAGVLALAQLQTVVETTGGNH